jgi:hypothetical protein
MTLAWCVRMDAVRGVALAGLLAATVAAGCSAPLREPPGMPPAPGYLQRVATLRVGLPATNRANLLFACDSPAAAPKLGTATYAPDSLDPAGRRWLRLPHATAADSAGALAPDTLIVRAFEDATDEEIAFERGELDAAVFWPGELSARMRSDARFRDPELGLRARGVLACVADPGDTLGAPRADMEVLNREAFGGDLMPWNELEPGPDVGAPARYVVDPAVPGARHLERILARIPSAGVRRTLKLAYLDRPVAAADAAAAAWRTPGVTPVFAVRCAVLVTTRARDGVRAIGAHAFAELAPCGGGARP